MPRKYVTLGHTEESPLTSASSNLGDLERDEFMHILAKKSKRVVNTRPRPKDQRGEDSRVLARAKFLIAFDCGRLVSFRVLQYVF